MNLLKASLRVKLGLTNPCTSSITKDQIKPQYCLLTAQNTRIQAKLVNKTQLNDHHFLRFQLPLSADNKPKCLGLKIGQYIWVELDGNRRPYVPISPIDEPNYVDLLVRDMRGKNVGSFTSKLLQLPIEAEVLIEGPSTQFEYEGFGKLKYTDTKTQQPKQKTFKNIGIITHSSAITTTYSLIESIAMNYDNRTGVSLLWLGDNQSDFVFKQQFASYVEQCKLNMNLMLTNFQKGWIGPYGKVNQEHIRDFMPFVESKEVIIMSGLEGEFAYIPQMIEKMGYKDYLNF